jgi:hypothetical protein
VGLSCTPHQILPLRLDGQRNPRCSDRPQLRRPAGRRRLCRPGRPPPWRRPEHLLRLRSGQRRPRSLALEPVAPLESLEPSATISMTGRGCGAVCVAARDPVLRALTGASGAASLAAAPELEIGGGRLRLAGLRERSNKDDK